MRQVKCDTCGQHIPDEVLKEKRRIRSENIKNGIYKAKNDGFVIGRPRKSNYLEILSLRNAGLSMGQIAKRLNISKGSVQHALKVVSPLF